MDWIAGYLDDLERAGEGLSEPHLCACFTERILRGLLGYEDGDWVINPHAGRDAPGEGTPDITVRAPYNGDAIAWLVVETKLNDSLIRDPTTRATLWADKRKYVTAETVYFLWVAKRTVLVCDPRGEVVSGLYLAEEETPPADPTTLATQEDGRAREHLDLISASQAYAWGFLERFREGLLPSRYLDVTRDTIDQLTDTLRGTIMSLRGYLGRRWDRLADQLAAYRQEQSNLESFLASPQGAMREDLKQLHRDVLAQKRRAPRHLFEYAFPVFCEQQAYTDWKPSERRQSQEAALADIFRTNAAYVILGRLLFVRFAEDQGDRTGRPLLPRKISNGGLKLWRQLVGAEEPYIGQLVQLAFRQAGSIFEQLFEETPFDALISLEDPEFDQVLLNVLYRLNAFSFERLDRDLLGDIYQKLLPRHLRKQMGEFYTDEEVVEYILQRTGFVEAARSGAPTVLDPACGSGTFLVRAAYHLIEGAQARGVSDEETLALVSRCIHGLDINDFAVFIARVNLLFTVFDLIARTRRDVSFRIHEANSLTGAKTPDVPVGQAPPDSAMPGRLTPGIDVRDDRYDFVVGNPPYVRAERLPSDDRRVLQSLYPKATEHNVDLAAYFMYRARAWLNDGGVFGMIVPRALTDARFSAPLRRAMDAPDLAVEEMTPCDWVCHELFDSDVVPAVIVFRRTTRAADHRVRLVHGLRAKSQLLGSSAEVPDPVETSVEWSRFASVAPQSLWPIEVTQDDLRIEEALQGRPRLESVLAADYGVKLGARCSARTEGGPRDGPLLTGSDVYSYFTAPAERFANIAEAEAPSLWAGTQWNAEQGLFSVLQVGRDMGEAVRPDLPAGVAVIAEVGITINAAALDPRNSAAQNTVVLAFWKENRTPIEALVGLLNSTLCRWYGFVFLRATVSGGGRRDHRMYPRSIEALPVPSRDGAAWAPRVAESAQRAAAAAVDAAPLDAEVWGGVVSTVAASSTLSAWPVHWQEWPDRLSLTKQSLGVVRVDPNTLKLTRSIALAAPDPSALDFLQTHLPVLVSEAGKLSKADLQGLRVPPPTQAATVVGQYADLLAQRDAARGAYLQAISDADEAVCDAFGLTDRARSLLERRMAQFPLSGYAAQYRKPWEPTRRPRIKVFEAGQRFH